MIDEDGTTSAHDLRVVDFGLGMATALIAKQFADLGARVFRAPPADGDPFDRLYPAHRFWRRDARIISADEADALLADADLCILGGEDHPGLTTRHDAASLQRRYPRLVVLHVTGYPASDARGGPAVDLLVQARTGLVYEQFSDRPIPTALPQPSYGAALQGLVGAWVALVERERSGKGQLVGVSLAAGAAMFWGPFWMKAEKADAGFDGITPRDVRHLILGCADGRYLQLTMGVPGAVAKIYGVLGIPHPVDPNDRGMPDHSRGPAKFYGDVDLLESYTREWPRDTLLAALRAAGVPAEAVLKPGESWDDEQTRINGVIATTPEGCAGVGSPIRVRPAAGGPTPLPERLRHYDEAAPPLAGVRIIDFGIFVAGPYASKLLADYGATVLRVEPPSGRSTLSGERTIIAANHGKLAICVDMKADEGRAIAASMCAEADIVLHNFRPGVAERLGFDQKILRGINPSLITLETTAYGPTGPKALAPGFDMVMQAHSGLQYRAGGIGNAPLCSRSPLVDFATGAVGAIGLLVGLFERFRTGRTLAAETNLLNVCTHMMAELIRAPDGTLHGAPALDATQTGTCPTQSLYQTRDGWIAVAIRSAAMAAALSDILGIPLPTSLATWGAAEREQIVRQVAGWESAPLLERLGSAGIWAEACAHDAWSRGEPDGTIVRQMDDAVYGAVVHCIGPLIEFSRSRTVPADRLSTPEGADSAAILGKLGIGREKADALFAARIVR